MNQDKTSHQAQPDGPPQMEQNSDGTPPPIEGDVTKKSKLIPILLCVTAILAVLGLATFVWLSNKRPLVSTHKPDVSTAVSVDNFHEKVIGYTNRVKGDFTYVTKNDLVPAWNMPVYAFSEKEGIFIALKGRKDWSAQLEVPTDSLTESRIKEVINVLGGYLKTDGFNTSNLQKYTDQYSAGSKLYEQKDIICELYGYDRYVYFICSENKDINKKAAELKPFYLAYQKVRKTPLSETVINIDITNVKKITKYPEYEVVSGSAGSPNGLGGSVTVSFFRTSGGEWILAYSGVTASECKEFNTLDKRKAFHDVSCIINKDTNLTTVGKHYGT